MIWFLGIAATILALVLFCVFCEWKEREKMRELNEAIADFERQWRVRESGG